MALPEEDRDVRRALYSEEEWEHAWELRSYPFQQAPPGESWKSWSVYSPPRVGATTAGLEWMLSKIFRPTIQGNAPASGLIILYFDSLFEVVGGRFSAEITRIQDPNWVWDVSSRSKAVLTNKADGRNLTLEVSTDPGPAREGRTPDYLWADDPTNAASIRAMFPGVRQFVFTGALHPDPDTIVSRAGDERPY